MNEPHAGSTVRHELHAELARWMAPREISGLPLVLTSYQRLGLLAGFVLLVLLRLPEATWHGRLLGEEGPIFLAYAWHRETWDALWRSFGGYLNLGANGSTLLAARLVQHGLMPLELVPRLTMGIALFFQTLPAALILWGRGNWLTTRWVYVVSLLMIALAPFSEEVWLNTLHIQFHLTLCCALILALEPPTTARGWSLQGMILLLAPLCGPGALVLGPLFLARTLLDRSPARLAQTAVLGLSGLVQLLIFFISSPLRGGPIDLPSLAALIFVRFGLVPVIGPTTGMDIAVLAFKARAIQSFAWWGFVGLSMGFLAMLAFAGYSYRRYSVGWLIAAGLCLAVGSFGGGMLAFHPSGWFNPTSGLRYNFVPSATIGIALVGIAQANVGSVRRFLQGICILVLLTGLTSYLSPWDLKNYAHYPYYEADWVSEVKLWRKDHNHPLRVWPTVWTADLSDVDRPCPEARLETASFDDPGYCESAWLAIQKTGFPHR